MMLGTKWEREFDKNPDAPNNEERLADIERYNEEYKDLSAQIKNLEAEILEIEKQIYELQDNQQ